MEYVTASKSLAVTKFYYKILLGYWVSCCQPDIVFYLHERGFQNGYYLLLTKISKQQHLCTDIGIKIIN
jgi:hypothetical protein